MTQGPEMFREWVRQVRCPLCHAKAGMKCRRADGMARTRNHLERIQKWNDREGAGETPNLSRTQTREMECPACAAPAGVRCVRWDGTPREASHAARVRARQAARYA